MGGGIALLEGGDLEPEGALGVGQELPVFKYSWNCTELKGR